MPSVGKAYYGGQVTYNEIKIMHSTYIQAANRIRRTISSQSISGGKGQTLSKRGLLDFTEIQ